MKPNAYHAGKLSSLVTVALVSLSGTSNLLAQRIVWACLKIPQIEFYLKIQDVQIDRPGLLKEANIDLTALIKKYPYEDEHTKIHNLHWRKKYKLVEQLVDYFCLALEVAAASSSQSIGKPTFQKAA